MPAGLESIIEQGPLSALRAVVEILLISYFFYRFLVVVRGTRAEPVLLGVAVIGVFYLLTGVLGLEALHGAMSAAGPYVFVVLIIIFQPEIRTLLRQITLQVLPSRRLSGLRRDVYEDVIFAVSQLAQTHTGALIVLERETGLRTFIQSGVALDARLSSDLLVSIFQRRSPLHDGAVIIRRERILAAACFLPLTTNPGLVATLGSRHRAAIGVTEESDCVTIAVSEINGRISLAISGRIELDVSIDHIREKLNLYFGRVVAPRAPREASAPTAAEPTALRSATLAAKRLSSMADESASERDETPNSELAAPPKMNVVLLVVLVVVTQGIFAPIWFLLRRKWINGLGEEKLGTTAPIVVLVLFGASLISSFVFGYEGIEDLLALAGGIIVIVLSFNVRTIVDYHFKTSLSGPVTVLLTIFYLQYKINRLQPPTELFTYR